MSNENPDPLTQLWQTLASLEAERSPHVLVQLIGVKGSAPQNAGAKMIVQREGLPVGTVGGGKIEAAAIRSARVFLEKTALENPHIEEVEWNLQRDIGMSCGGSVRLLFEARYVTSWTVAIFGAGHISQSLIPLLLPLPVSLICVDPRREWLDRLPVAANLRLIESAGPEWVCELPTNAAMLSITQGHGTDLPILDLALQRGDFAFLGCIGSEVKAHKLRTELREKGHSEEKVASLHCPLGLDIGNNHPQEIAISIAAQLLAHRDKRGEIL